MSSLNRGYGSQGLSSDGYSPSLLSSLTLSNHVSLDCIMLVPLISAAPVLTVSFKDYPGSPNYTLVLILKKKEIKKPKQYCM